MIDHAKRLTSFLELHVFRQECKDLTTIFLKLKYMYPQKLIDSTFT